ncbi:MAG: hypothetical protein J6S60_07325 [Oscillospiraceae bacterium]|nr:hypothetical protein [Oscillospiraceae bacterium]
MDEKEKSSTQYTLDIINSMHEHTESRLWKIILALILVIALETGVFVWYLSQYDFTGVNTEISQDADGLNIVGTRNGAYVYGTESASDAAQPDA